MEAEQHKNHEEVEGTKDNMKMRKNSQCLIKTKAIIPLVSSVLIYFLKPKKKALAKADDDIFFEVLKKIDLNILSHKQWAEIFECAKNFTGV